MVRLGLVVAMAVLAGCGEDPEPEPFAFLRVYASGPLEGGDLRLAVVWADYDDALPEVQVTDDVGLARDETAQLSLRRMPTDDAFFNFDDINGDVANGYLIAYDDRDGDGRLDFTRAGDPGFRDHVVGWAPGMRLVMAPMASELSVYEAGLNLELSVMSDLGTTSVLLPFDYAIPVELFDVPETACFGLVPHPASIPAAVHDAIDLLDPQPGTRWPYLVGIPPCPNNELPSEWFDINCFGEPGGYAVSSLVWPADEGIAEMCGWTQHYCLIEFGVNRIPPPEFPSCE